MEAKAKKCKDCQWADSVFFKNRETYKCCNPISIRYTSKIKLKDESCDVFLAYMKAKDMKYYIQTSVSYKKNICGNLYGGKKIFSNIIDINNKPKAKKEAIKLSLDKFNKEYTMGYQDIKCQVEGIYRAYDFKDEV